MAHNLVDTPLERCHEMLLHEGSPSLSCDNVIPSSLERSHVSPMLLEPSFSPEHSFDVPNDISKLSDSNIDLDHKNNMFNMLGGSDENFGSLGYFSVYDAAVDPYCIYLVDKARKIMWNTLFHFSFDFSISFALIKRALNFFTLILCMLSYCQAWQPYAEEFDKLLRA